MDRFTTAKFEFDSDSERIFAIVLENDKAVEKWMSQQEEQNAHQALVTKAPRLSSN